MEGRSFDRWDKTISEIVPVPWKVFNLKLFGATECSDTYHLLVEPSDNVDSVGKADRLSPWPDNDERCGIPLKAGSKTESEVDKVVNPQREAEIKAYEKAADSALEKILANIVVLLGICLATALAPWTSFRTTNATAAQIGSYALLLSISTGLLALVSSITQLTNATASAKTILLLQEQTIELNLRYRTIEEIPRDLLAEPSFGFSTGIAKEFRLTLFSLWRLMGFRNQLSALLFGPALLLIPRFSQSRLFFILGFHWLKFTVRDVTFAYNIYTRYLIRLVPDGPPPGKEIKQDVEEDEQ